MDYQQVKEHTKKVLTKSENTKKLTDSQIDQVANEVYKRIQGKNVQEKHEVIVAENVKVNFNTYLEVQE